MPRYIDADTLAKTFENITTTADVRSTVFLNAVLTVIEGFPTADVAPVVRGEWEKVRFSRGIMACSACGYYFQESQMPHRNFCPACGARMKGGA